MRAVIAKEAGGPEVLTLAERPDPEPGRGEVRIAVHATALNRADLLQRRGLYPPPAGESDVLGLECAGVVDCLGPNTSQEWLDRKVMTLLAAGGYAERVVVPERMLMPLPTGWSFEQGAAVPEAFLTASEALFSRAVLLPNETVLIHAAAGGVGSAAVQLAKQEGARVFATTSQKKCKAVEGLGAQCFDRQQADFEKRVSKSVQADVIIDFVGAPYWHLHERILNVGGRIVIVGVLGGARAQVDLGVLLRKRQSVLGMVMRSLPWSSKIAITRRFCRTHYAGLTDGRLLPVVDRVFELHEASEAHRYMEQNQNIGKIILRVGRT